MKIIKHPEIQNGEVFICNCDSEGFADFLWTTKRLGQIAYGRDGKELPKGDCKLFPVFVSRKELEQAGVTFEE